MALKFTSEAELCAKFLSALPKGWTAYAETGGWDVVLVRADGFQIGVQAKMKFNAHVLSQALDDSFHSASQEGPDCRAILVPAGERQNHMARIAAYCGITVILCWPEPTLHWPKRIFEPDLPENRKHSEWFVERDWHELAPAKRIDLPAYVPDVAAGASAPVQLTEWKIKALKIAVLLEIRGFVTLKDFSHLRLDHRRWTGPETRWLVKEGGVLKPGPGMRDFKAQHPKVYEQIKADIAQWERKEPTGAPRLIP